ncbi:N-acetylneuraminate synthase family protein [Chloroflexota bacterium]
MPRVLPIRRRMIGEGQQVYIVAEIGINHNGDIHIAKRLIDAAKVAGCDAVKFQKRTPEICVPEEQRNLMRDTPWGTMTYMEYRRRIEFSQEEYQEIDRYCQERGIIWFASVWDRESVDFMEEFEPPCYKIPSAALTNHGLLRYARARKRPIILSTGMSTLEQIWAAVNVLGTDDLLITHCTSTYPCRPDELNLRMIQTLENHFECPIGYSGHEVGLQTTYAAIVLGASLVERHITLDRAMWGSDQAASVEPHGFARLVRDIRVIEAALGDGNKVVYESEMPIRRKLRTSGA